jgi:pimeloyl-ACP methyl ester carboxylesterase
MKDVLIFVPGLLGSELYDNVGGIVERAAGFFDIYGRWLNTFRALTRRGQQLFDDRSDPPSLYTVPYDWRIAIEDSCRDKLAPLIRKARQDWGDQVAIHLIAHSLGGLVSRYYLQSGQFDAESGFGSIKTLITFGTPHNGAPVALAGALGLHKTNFMSTAQSTQLANDERYPVVYQTFPLFDAPVIWKRKRGERLEPITLADRTFATQKLQLNANSLDKALAFRQALEHAPIPRGIRQFLLIGTRFDTITHLNWSGTAASTVETPESGDGTVSLQGAYIAGAQVQFTGESHVELIDSNFARMAFQLLLDAEGVAAAAAGRLILSVRDLSVDIGDDVHVRIKSEDGVSLLRGRLVWEQALIAAQPVESEPQFGAVDMPPPVPIEYGGPVADALALRLKTPTLPGIYRLRLVHDGHPDEVSASFVVRQP